MRDSFFIIKYCNVVKEYIKNNFVPSACSGDSTIQESNIGENSDNHILYSMRDDSGTETNTEDNTGSRILYSTRGSSSPNPNVDKFCSEDVGVVMRSYLLERRPQTPLSSVMNLTFSDKLIQYIGNKGITEPELYRAAQIDRRLFSKIISNRNYQPSKDTVLAFVFALELTLSEANDLLERAGYSLSHSIKRDVILEYFIKERVFDLGNINAFLYDMNEKIIGRNV